MLSHALQQLATQYGVQLSYADSYGQTRQAAPEALVAVLRALGLPLERAEDAERALAAQAEQQGLLEPVLVAWNGLLGAFAVRAPWSVATALYELRLEDGSLQGGQLQLQPAKRGLTGHLPQVLPHGYHQLSVRVAGEWARAHIISAPMQAYVEDGRSWGAFLPLYSVRSSRNQGIGDYGKLSELARWIGGLGGDYVCTLPLLATFLDRPFEPSPYSPVSRLFWSDAFIDVLAARELLVAPSDGDVLSGSELGEIERLNHAELVDYHAVAALKRRVLERLALCFVQSHGEQSADFRAFEKDYPRARDYAAFRAACDRQQQGWPAWPTRMQDGRLEPSDYHADHAAYHRFSQYAATRQLAAISHARGARLYLDLPLGVHPDGYDSWRERDLFAPGVATGAPPDAFFTQGQNWGFAPMRPNALRVSGYAYLRAALQTHLRYAAVLRLDHVMALHRLFWVPAGMPAVHGVYVRYPAAELYALLTLESHRHHATIVGEDLGTVPPEVREQMGDHRIARMFVVQFEARSEEPDSLPPPPALSVACLNTHDMPTFEAFRRGLDADLRGELGLIDAEEIAAVRHDRRALLHALAEQLRRAGFLHGLAQPEQVRDALLACLAASPASLVLVNLEDLWREERPQNVPGTSAERPNWRRRTRPSLEEIVNEPEVAALLSRLNEIRRET
ncbi:MAG: 4-alpha-glucanotransferase [Longimicrobiales bacterium]